MSSVPKKVMSLIKGTRPASYFGKNFLKRGLNIKCSGKGFTLIELIVVISIIALLISITVPALIYARKVTKRVICLSRMKQIALAFKTYANDNDDWIITAKEMVYSHTLKEALGVWNISLLPYIGHRIHKNPLDNYAEVWFCPMDKDPYPRGFKNCPHKGLTSYALNGYYENDLETSREVKLGPGGRYRFYEIRHPSECMLMGETSYAAQFYDVEHPNVQDLHLRIDGHHRMTTGFFHDGTMNMVFVDGHVGNIKGVKSPVDDRYVPPNYCDGKFQFWPELSLPSASEQPQFWGPGYN
jgi:prepilin-type N-terminal cleavage/methylation domain-containing protein/prepilin-type processing-associated H-X9-DG protein